MKQAPTLPRSGIFRGWFVVASAFAVTFVGFGSAYTFSAFLESLQRDFGASRGSVSLVFSLAGFLYFGLGIVTGPLADRFGSRPLAVTGMLLVGLGLAAASAARSLVEVYAAYGLGVGLGVGMRLCARDRRGAALVRAAARLCLGAGGERDRRRHAGDAAAGNAADRHARMARRLPRARLTRCGHRRRNGAAARKRSARRAALVPTAIRRNRAPLRCPHKAPRCAKRSARHASSRCTPLA